MDVASTRNAAGKSGSQGSSVDSDDDDSGGKRGCRNQPPIASRSSSPSIIEAEGGALTPHSSKFINGSKSETRISDPLDVAIVDSVSAGRDHCRDFSSGEAPALMLDRFFQAVSRGKATDAPTFAEASVAQGSLSTGPSAVSRLKKFGRSEPRDIHPPKYSVEPPVPEDQIGSLTFGSSSPSSDSSSSNSSDDVDLHQSHFAESFETARPFFRAVSMVRHPSEQTKEQVPVENPNLPLKSLIKRICVAGVEAKLTRSRHNRQTFCLSVAEIQAICQASRELFLSQPTFLRLGTPVKVVGDLHGQFKDLMRILRVGGMPPDTSYLFLGDYVDRGKQSLETIMLLLCLKLRYPDHVFMLRGNHECAGVTKVYGFYDECKRRSSIKAWRALVDVFNCLPIAAVVGERIFCVHGGLSPYLQSLSDIDNIQRPTDVPDTGIISDLLWSDPDPQVKEWSDNDRGVSYCFGQRTLEKFCSKQGIELVVRGHMVVEDGYEFFGGRKLVTVFSAPNYCGDFDNWGAIMSIDENLLCSFDLLEPLKVTKPRRHHHGGSFSRTTSTSRQ